MNTLSSTTTTLAHLCIALALGGCAASLGAVGSYVPTDPKNAHVGAEVEGHIHLPQNYDWILGLEGAHLGQVYPASRIDQGRFMLVGGYSNAPLPYENVFGFESTLRLGAFRGSNGPLVTWGVASAATISPLIRLSPSQPAWRSDGLADTVFVLVPYASAGLLMRPGAHFQPEFGGGVAFRIYLWSSLVP
jgi:hypothetical protein